MAARLFQEAEVSSTSVNVKFNYTLDIDTISSSAFTLTIPTATPTVIAGAFKDVDIYRDFNSIGRILTLYFDVELAAETTYRITASGMSSVSGSVIADDYFEFTTTAATETLEEIIPESQVYVVEDFSIKSIIQTEVAAASIVSADHLLISSMTPESEVACYLSNNYDNGVIKIKFNYPVAANYLTSEFFKVQRKSVTGYISRWETVATQTYYDSVNKTVLVCLPSIEADEAVVYMTADRDYWEDSYRYRLRISSQVSSAANIKEQSVIASTYDLVCFQGSTFTREISFTNNAGDVIDLSGYTAKMQVRPTAGSATLIIELSTANGRMTLDGPAGKVTLNLTALETAALMSGGVYDLELTSAGGIVTRALEGKFILRPEVTV